MIGSLGQIVRKGRWRYLPVYGRACRYCAGGILWLKRDDNNRQIPIEPGSWDGEEWFTPRVHVYHGRKCVRMRKAMKRRHPDVDPGLIL